MFQTLIKVRQNLFLTFILAQVGWFACVLGAAHGYGALGVFIALVITAWHVTFNPRPLPELKLVLWVGVVGLVGETLLAETGFLFMRARRSTPVAPPTGLLLFGCCSGRS